MSLFTVTKLSNNNARSDGPSVAEAQQSQTVPAFQILRLDFACFFFNLQE